YDLKTNGVSKEQALDMARLIAALHYHYAKAIVEAVGEAKGRQIVATAIQRYGEERGRKIRRRAEAAGRPLNLESQREFYDLPLGELWEGEGKRKGNQSLSRVDYCPFAEYWREVGGEELGRLYCHQDEALARAFNSAIEFTCEKNVLEGDAYCQMRSVLSENG
ncbi:MAG: L-2-amino-thiazoline-4-carboxylic acid hydrolase, partial [Anaerolineae bacterium]